MTVQELIDKLKTFPPDLTVMHPEEGSLYYINSSTVRIGKTAPCTWVGEEIRAGEEHGLPVVDVVILG